MSKKGTLYLIPSPLSSEGFLRSTILYNMQIMAKLHYYVVESTKCGRRFLSQVSSTLCDTSGSNAIPTDDLVFFELNEHTDTLQISPFLDPLLKGFDMGVISDAGCPCVGDPGRDIVLLAHNHDITVVPLVGASAIIMAIMASGLNGQNFAFNGYLPVKQTERVARLRFLENRARKENQTQSFIEAPYRNSKILQTIVDTLRSDTVLCVACDITGPREYIKTLAIGEWQKILHAQNGTFPQIEKTPSMFILGVLSNQ